MEPGICSMVQGAPEGDGAVGRDLHAVEAHDDVVRLQVAGRVCHRADRAHHDALLIGLHLVRLPASSAWGVDQTSLTASCSVTAPGGDPLHHHQQVPAA